MTERIAMIDEGDSRIIGRAIHVDDDMFRFSVSISYPRVEDAAH